MKEIIDEYLKESERYIKNSKLSRKVSKDSEQFKEVHRYSSIYEGILSLYYQNKAIIEMLKQNIKYGGKIK